jgi:hypothetical protein
MKNTLLTSLAARFPLLAVLLPTGAACLSLFAPEAPMVKALNGQQSTPAPIELVRVHTNLPELSHSRVVETSTLALCGRVLSITPFEFRPGWISRRVELSIEDCWHGDPRATEIVILHGGRLGNKVTIDDSAPDVRVGEEVVFYMQDVAGQVERLLSAGNQAVGRVTGPAYNRQVELRGVNIAINALVERDRGIQQQKAQAKQEEAR